MTSSTKNEILWHPTEPGWQWLNSVPMVERSSKLKIPDEFESATVRDFGDGEVVRSDEIEPVSLKTSDLVRLVAEGPTSVMINGKNGSGKSHLAAALGRQWGAAWLDTLDFVSMTYAARRRSVIGEQGEDEIVRRYVSYPCLLLDDITTATAHEHGVVSILRLLKHRIEDRRPTIVTSFSSIDGIATRMDWSIASRLSAFLPLRVVYRGHPSGDRRRPV